MYRLSMILQNNLDSFLDRRTKEPVLLRHTVRIAPHGLCPFALLPLKKMYQSKLNDCEPIRVPSAKMSTR